MDSTSSQIQLLVLEEHTLLVISYSPMQGTFLFSTICAFLNIFSSFYSILIVGSSFASPLALFFEKLKGCPFFRKKGQKCKNIALSETRNS